MQCSPTLIANRLQDIFVRIWEGARASNRKLLFYNNIKPEFGLEAYLWPVSGINHEGTMRIAQLRSSSHRYNVETGRYGQKITSVVHRICQICCDGQNVATLAELPFFEPIIEDELHVLRTCPAYHDLSFGWV